MSEQLVNEHFNDFPIDYFKIEKEDFVLAYGASTENPNISDFAKKLFSKINLSGNYK